MTNDKSCYVGCCCYLHRIFITVVITTSSWRRWAVGDVGPRPWSSLQRSAMTDGRPASAVVERWRCSIYLLSRTSIQWYIFLQSVCYLLLPAACYLLYIFPGERRTHGSCLLFASESNWIRSLGGMSRRDRTMIWYDVQRHGWQWMIMAWLVGQ